METKSPKITYPITQPHVTRALKVAELGVFDGAHHKDWVIQQMIKELNFWSDDQLAAFLKESEWEPGIAP